MWQFAQLVLKLKNSLKRHCYQMLYYCRILFVYYLPFSWITFCFHLNLEKIFLKRKFDQRDLFNCCWSLLTAIKLNQVSSSQPCNPFELTPSFKTADSWVFQDLKFESKLELMLTLLKMFAKYSSPSFWSLHFQASGFISEKI